MPSTPAKLPSFTPPSLFGSPLSSLGRTPSPPIDYPSPPLSNPSEFELPPSMAVATSQKPLVDGPPPAKKRKLGEQKPRTLERLDLCTLDNSLDQAHVDRQNLQLKRLVGNLRGKRKIVVVAGAGISVSAGIPDFRSSTGLFKTMRSQHKLKSSGKELFDASVYRNDSSTSSFHSMVRELAHLTQRAEPTLFHHMLASMAEQGRLMRLYTQNVDGIDTTLKPLATRVPLNLKGPWPKSVQLHGGLEKMACSKCSSLPSFKASLFEGPEPPACPECAVMDEVRIASGLRSHGIGRLRPRMVLYNEFNPDSDAIGNVSHADLKSRPDAVLVVGTSLKIPGIRRLVRELCAVTRSKRGGFTAWINLDEPPTEFKDSWDMVIKGESDEVARYVNLPHWDDMDHENASLVHSDEEREFASRRVKPEVLIQSMKVAQLEVSQLSNVPKMGVFGATSSSVVFGPTGICTPRDSPRQRTPTHLDAFAKMKHSALQKRHPLPDQKAKATPENLKIKKKPGPKPGSKLRKKNAEKNSIETSMKVSKSISHAPNYVKNQGAQQMKSPGSKPGPDSSPKLRPVEEERLLFLDLASPTTATATKHLKAISYSDLQPNIDLPLPIKSVDTSTCSIPSVYYSASEKSNSPPRRHSDGSLCDDNKGTISPKGVPIGMVHLLDV